MSRLTAPLLLACAAWVAAVNGNEAGGSPQRDGRPDMAADMGAGADLLASGCDGCHGRTNGRADEIPDLSSLSVEDIESRLLAYKRQERSATVMNRIATGYSDHELEQLAIYFGRASR
jgi:sulfide dehydrogenase cytochrome subunit